MFKCYLFSKHKDIYRAIAKEVGCSPRQVYNFAHKSYIIANTDLEEKIKDQLLAHKMIRRGHHK